MRFSVQNELNLLSMGDSLTAARVTGASMIQTYPFLMARAKGYGNVTNVGISGNTTAQMLARFSTDALAHHAGAVSIMGGTNDMTTNVSGGVWVGGGTSVATTKANLKSMVEQAQAQRARVTLLSFWPELSAAYQDNTPPYLTAFTEIASETGCEYVDIYAAVMALSEVARNALYIEGDVGHPNADGHAFMAEQALLVNGAFDQFAP